MRELEISTNSRTSLVTECPGNKQKFLKEFAHLLVDEFIDSSLTTCPGFWPSWIQDYRIDDRRTSKNNWAVLLTYDTGMGVELRCHVQLRAEVDILGSSP